MTEPPRPARDQSLGASLQDRVNREVYTASGVYLYYLSRSLTRVENACVSRYQAHILDRDVLDVGVGAGRTARYFLGRTRRYEAIDYSPVMVNYLKRKLPEISVHQADFRDLGIFADGSFDLVFATANVIDALPHEGRLNALRESCRVLRQGGILAFSAHNIHYRLAFSGPRLGWSWNPIRLGIKGVAYILGSWNHRRLAPLRTRTSEYALLDDTGHFYSCLHYYAARSVVRSQLASAGIQLLEVLDRTGRPIGDTQDDSEHPWLFYIAQRPSSA